MKCKSMMSAAMAAVLWAIFAYSFIETAVATPYPGPDRYGYRGTEIPFKWRDISQDIDPNDATRLGGIPPNWVCTGCTSYDDAMSSQIAIGFPFKFYGTDYSALYISANGFITFTPSTLSSATSQSLPNPASPNNLIAGFWEDLNYPQGNIRYQILGAEGNREFVVGFYDVPHFNNKAPVSFEIILHEGSNAIELQYLHAPNDNVLNDPDTQPESVGIENANGTQGLQVAYGKDVSFTEQGFMLTRQPTFAVAKSEASVPEGRSGIPLNGGESFDGIGSGLTYLWEQITPTSPAVTIADSAAATTSFDAPWISDNTILTFRLTVTDATGNSDSDTVNVNVVNVNHAPIADAGDDVSVKPNKVVSLDGNQSYDPDSDALLFYVWSQTGGPAVSLDTIDPVRPSFVTPNAVGHELTFDLVVSDGQESSVADHVTVAIVENSPPEANAGSDQTTHEHASVILNGTASSDVDDVTLTYLWQQTGVPSVTLSNPNSSTPEFTAPWVGPGGETLRFNLTVSDNDPINPKSATDEVVVHVLNSNDPPNCSLARPSVGRLWPPRRGMIAVSIVGITDPDANNVSIDITGVSQDEPTHGTGDGDTSPDAVIQQGSPSDIVLLRAERRGGGSGRVYTVDFTATDGFESCTGSVQVSVPHDRRDRMEGHRPRGGYDSRRHD